MSYDHARSACLYPKGCSGCPSDDELTSDRLLIAAFLAAIEAEQAKLRLLQELWRQQANELRAALRR